MKNCAGLNNLLTKICPMDSLWTVWTPWTNCSATCGQSSKQRTRSCVDGRYGGVKCDRQFEKETQNCQTKERYSQFLRVGSSILSFK